MKRILSLVLIGVFTLVSISACGKSGANSTPGKQNENGGKKKSVAILLNGTRGDKAFFDSAAHGGELMEKAGIPVKIVEMTYDETRWEPTLTDYAQNPKYDPIIVGTWQMSEKLTKIAPKYPAKHFILYDSSVDYKKNPECKNVYSIEYKQNECSYFAGMVAAYASKKGQLGFVGGMENYVINDFLIGYIQGAKSVNPSVKINIGYVGNFSDAAKAKELTLAQIHQGADVIYQAASTAGLGVIDACAQEGVWAIGVDSDQAAALKEKDPKKAAAILTSALKRVDNSIFQTAEKADKGELQYGQTVNLGLKEEAVDIVFGDSLKKALSTEQITKIKDMQKEIIDGKIVVRSAFGLTADEINAIKASVK